MDDFESRGSIENDILGLYSKIHLEGEEIMNIKVKGLAILMGSYQITLIETQEERELDAVI